MVAGSNPVRPATEETEKRMTEFNIQDHHLVPEHILLTDEQRQDVLGTYNASLRQFPIIRDSDPGIAHLSAKPGDVIMVKRNSDVTGVAVSYRVVIHD